MNCGRRSSGKVSGEEREVKPGQRLTNRREVVVNLLGRSVWWKVREEWDGRCLLHATQTLDLAVPLNAVLLKVLNFAVVI